MTDFKIQIPLIQHTPILHFQGEYADEGATLRATELKPKLDRYITVNHSGPIPIEWKIGKTNALNYKLRITAFEEAVLKGGQPPMFFGEGKNLLQISHMKDSRQIEIMLELFCNIESLYENLKSVDWKSFFLANNFGTRQSKGYGSFFVDSQNSGLTSMIGKSIINGDASYRVDSFFTITGNANDWKGVMTQIGDVYKCMRGGINENGLYFKSLMFSYARYYKSERKKDSLYWDKRMIKEIFYPIIREQQLKYYFFFYPLLDFKDNEINQIPFLFRDYLGLSSNESWAIPYHAKLSKKNNVIARFKSPILFKPLFINNQWIVFLLHREIPQGFINKRFEVHDKHSNKTIYMNTYPSFSMDEYINFVLCVKDYNRIFSIKKDTLENRTRKKNIVTNLNNLRTNFIQIEKSNNT